MDLNFSIPIEKHTPLADRQALGFLLRGSLNYYRAKYLERYKKFVGVPCRFVLRGGILLRKSSNFFWGTGLPQYPLYLGESH